MVVFYNISAKVGIFREKTVAVYRFYLLRLCFWFHYEGVAVVFNGLARGVRGPFDPDGIPHCICTIR